MKQSPIETQIDLVVVLKTLWTGKYKILLYILGFAIFGVILAFLTPKEYTAKIIWVNQSESSFTGRSSVEGLAAMVGFDMRSVEGSNEISTEDYEDFIETLGFQYALMHTPLGWRDYQDSLTLVEYYSEYYRPGVLKTVRNWTFGLPKRILDGMGNANEDVADDQRGPRFHGDDTWKSNIPRKLSDTEVWIRYILMDKMELTLNEGLNLVSLEVELRDPVAAAELARAGERLLKEKITALKVDKAKKNLAFTQRLYDEKKVVFQEAQDKLAKFRDRNMNLGSERARKEEEILESDYQIAFSVYSEMAAELETAKIRVEEDTPMFSVVEEAIIPNGESKPKKVRFLLIWAFLGGFIGFIVVLSRPIVKKVKNRWSEIDTE